MAATDLTITRAGAEAIDQLEPLWAAMHEHHVRCAAGAEEVAPFRTAEESWTRRRKSYEEWLSGDGGFALLAERDGRLVGYAVVTLGGGGTVLATGEKTGELESLSVLPEERGQGVGAMLMDEARAQLRKAGVAVWGLGVMVGNDDAVGFYERQGLRPFMVEMIGRIDP